MGKCWKEVFARPSYQALEVALQENQNAIAQLSWAVIAQREDRPRDHIRARAQ
jgi:hypothetical protein